jgi:AcrR family transcriptional regulator
MVYQLGTRCTRRRPWGQAVPRQAISCDTVGDVPPQGGADTTAARRASSRLPGREQRRRQIIDAAIAAIEESGPAALTGQIADKAGLARTHFYRHFASKEDLDLAVARHAQRDLTSRIRATLAVNGTPLEVIRAPVSQHVKWAQENPNLYRFLVDRGYRRSPEQPKRGGNAFAAEIAIAAARYFPPFGADPQGADRNIVTVMGLLDSSILWWLDTRDVTQDELVERLTRQTWLIVNDRLRELGNDLDPNVPLADRD